ncbi:hypothetical protein H681_10200 [Pseudomonas sp. ATCC 13867]|uniref:hypothetical protein n=1 Tax=Pseudomonas sp. ATCC 13867 TaxID=1294143 RepID=UPI0002C4DD56|nr:hypothetical protein [Pseudomonas sp. ATCC 13867]AGI23914.1 hypothetical protein H681_10200 [Pseudomonas sp. ATCC 13867]RFQ39640.1 hypothetical protein D0N87_05110 [Pseudomonas sp. ATCC 13867]RFQ40477.1 hypothetical protein D0N87_03960 [Pseudomonas sp. ATCC 13867]
MNACYRLVLLRPIAGFAPGLRLPELYREQQRIDSLLSARRLPPISHFLCPFGCDEVKGDQLGCWFDADSGRRLVQSILDLLQGRTLECDNRPALLQELFALRERLDAARFNGNLWQLNLELAFA